jgi:hypothetical protein
LIVTLTSNRKTLFSFAPFSAAPAAVAGIRRRRVLQLISSASRIKPSLRLFFHRSRQFNFFKDGSGNNPLMQLLLHVFSLDSNNYHHNE